MITFDRRRRRSINRLSMRFSDGGAQPPVDPAASAGAGEGDGSATGGQAPDVAMQLQQLTERLNSEIQRREKAEKAIENNKKKEKQVTEGQTAEAQQIEQLRQEIECQRNLVAAEKTFVAAGFAEDDYSELLPLIATADAESTNAIASGLVKLAKSKAEAAVAQAEQKRLNGTKPPRTSSNPQIAFGVETATNLGKAAAAARTQSNDALKHYNIGG